MKTRASILSLIAAIILAFAANAYTPRAGFVPDEKTAISIAEAVLIPIYGEQKILSERPFKATLIKGAAGPSSDSWVVRGTLKGKNARGGVAEVRISKESGCILLVNHGC